MAQPGVSQQIRRLEEELGAPLFDRSGRIPWLTTAGKALLPYTRAALEAADAGRASLTALNGVVSGRCNMEPSPASPESTSRPARAFHAAHPRVEITLDEGSRCRSSRVSDAMTTTP